MKLSLKTPKETVLKYTLLRFGEVDRHRITKKVKGHNPNPDDDHCVDTYPTSVLPETTDRNTTLPSVHLVALTNIK